MPTNSKTVYIINRSGHDFSDAERFGKLVFLSSGTMPRFGVTNMYRQFVDHLKDSKPEDYLLVTGLTIMNVVAAAIFGYLHGRINLLLFKDNGYKVRKIILSELLGKKEKK